MGIEMLSKWRVDLDPLDLEILERALEGALATMKEKGVIDDLEGEMDLEAALSGEIIEIARPEIVHRWPSPGTRRTIVQIRWPSVRH